MKSPERLAAHLHGYGNDFVGHSSGLLLGNRYEQNAFILANMKVKCNPRIHFWKE